MKKIVVLLVFAFLVFCSCNSGPEPVEDSAGADIDIGQDVEPVEAPASTGGTFDSNSLSQARKDSIKVDVQQLIQDLNMIIRRNDYNAWVKHLDPDYLKKISEASYLEEITEMLYKKDLGIAKNTGKDTSKIKKTILKTPRDYFNYIVVPSRSNDRVDDVEFITANRVKAFTINKDGERRRLYDLEQTDLGWKIIS